MTRAGVMESSGSSEAEALSRRQFEEFYNRTAPPLLAYIRRVAGNAAAADDLLQETYIRMLSAPSLPGPQRKSYLYRTATNLITDYHRAQSRQRRWWEFASRRVEAVDPTLELASDVERLFLLLPPRDRALLWLAYVEQAQHREIAAVLGLAEKSVKVLLHRARVKMEEHLKAHGFEGPQ